MLVDFHSLNSALVDATTLRHRLQTSACCAGSRRLATLLVIITALISPSAVQATPKPPNILFVIMDDVGIDQMTVFGYGGLDDDPGDAELDGRPPQTPTLQTLATAGVRFRNTWSMPACSTSRAVFFTGRYPLRTNVLGALGPADLANAQVSPFEQTLPKLLKPRGYKSALFGKFHLGLQGLNPYINSMPQALGWDYFYGWLDETGDPSSIDTSAGGVRPEGTYSCGFVPGASDDVQNGADEGACYSATGQCQNMVTAAGVPPGRACRDNGGILDPQALCQPAIPSHIQQGFKNLSAHYVSPLYINGNRVARSDIRARTYRGTAPVDAAIDWIGQQPDDTPWMASVSFASAHTPAMQPPQDLLSSDPLETSAVDCSAVPADPNDPEQVVAVNLAQRELTTLMIEALDTELARLLVSIGAATSNPDGTLEYNPDNSDIMVIVLGDNGTLGDVVKLPFNASRAKGTAYQTGVWVPLIISGPLVGGPNREVLEMVNIADLYYLFGEIAGIADVPGAVPRKLDAQPVLSYLKTSDYTPVRSSNFAQVGPNVQANGTVNPPCTIGGGCTQIPVSASVCNDNGGTWWGPGSPDPINEGGTLPDNLTNCCDVNVYAFNNTPADQTLTLFKLQPLSAQAIRDMNFKIVRNQYLGSPTTPDDWTNDGTPPNCQPVHTDEFYAVEEGTEDDPTPLLDDEDFEIDLAERPDLQPIYDELNAELDEILRSERRCPPPRVAPQLVFSLDGNIDGMIDRRDVAEWNRFRYLGRGGSSWYDLNLDGKTDSKDVALLDPYLPSYPCPPE